MNELKEVNSAGMGNPIDSPSREEDLALWLDLAIPKLLGLRAEVCEGFVKVWPREVETPDDTNFLIGARFTENLDESKNILDGLGAALELHEEGGHHWAVVTLPQGSIETNETTSPEMAAAFAVYAVLWGLRKGGGKS